MKGECASRSTPRKQANLRENSSHIGSIQDVLHSIIQQNRNRKNANYNSLHDETSRVCTIEQLHILHAPSIIK